MGAAVNWELLHRVNSIVIGIFVCTHLFAHACAAVSPELHAQWLAYFARFYRDPLYETLFLFLLVVQVFSGIMEFKLLGVSPLRLVRNLSGLYLAAFMLLHVGSVLYARHIDLVPTDFYWVAASMAEDPFRDFAIVFYALGVFSFFAHLICVLALSLKAVPLGVSLAMWAAAVAIALLIVSAFAGLFYPIKIPELLDGYYESKLQALQDAFGAR